MTKKSSGVGALIGVIVIAILIAPTLALLIGWLIGYIIELFIGDNPTNWLNVTLGTDRFARGDLPKVTAVLALVAMFFVRTPEGGDKS